MKSGAIKTAVITGAHSYDVLGFHALFRGLEGVDAYIQHVEDFTASEQAVRDSYDVVLFYGMPVDTPTDEGAPWYAGTPRSALEHLGQTEQGIVVLHHALIAYPQWPIWSRIVGIDDRTFEYHPDQTIHVDVASPEHPITQGLEAWDMIDEAYVMVEPAAGSHVLLTTECPVSMRTLGWTRQYGKSRVFCFACGHDRQAWQNGGFREILRRGIVWCGGHLS